jgi:hypothetical protein
MKRPLSEKIFAEGQVKLDLMPLPFIEGLKENRSKRGVLENELIH